MRSRWLLNLGLLALVTVIAVVAVSKRAANKTQPKVRLTTLEANRINSVRIQHRTNDLLQLEKNKDGWFLVAPLRARANQLRVQSLLRLATATSELRMPIEGDALSKYGLDEDVRIWLNNEEIRLGMRHPFKNALYVLYKDTLHLVTALDFDPRSQRYTALISHRLLAENQRPVAFALPELMLTLTDGKWTLQPANDDITPDRINRFVDEWRFARALTVERYGGQPIGDWIRITVTDERSTESDRQQLIELGILRDSSELVLYRKDQELEYRFTEEAGKRLLNIKSE